MMCKEGGKPRMDHVKALLVGSDLLTRLSALKRTTHPVAGIWPGHWRTDSLALDPEALLTRLKGGGARPVE